MVGMAHGSSNSSHCLVSFSVTCFACADISGLNLNTTELVENDALFSPFSTPPHKTVEYPELEGAHTDHWSPTPRQLLFSPGRACPRYRQAESQDGQGVALARLQYNTQPCHDSVLWQTLGQWKDAVGRQAKGSGTISLFLQQIMGCGMFSYMCKWLREMGLPLESPSNFLITTGDVYREYMTALSLSSHPWAQLGRGNILSGHVGKAEMEAVRCSCKHRVNTACFGAIWEDSHPLTSLLQLTLSSGLCIMSKLSCFILERGRERKMSNLEVCWSNEMCLVLGEQGQACKLCHCSVCSFTREGQGCKKQLKIVSVCLEESWQLKCPVGVTRCTIDTSSFIPYQCHFCLSSCWVCDNSDIRHENKHLSVKGEGWIDSDSWQS